VVGNRGVEEVVDLAKLVLLGGMEFPFLGGGRQTYFRSCHFESKLIGGALYYQKLVSVECIGACDDDAATAPWWGVNRVGL